MGIPGEVALQIANNLNVFLSGDVQKSIDRMPTDNIEAYECLQQAKNLFQTQLYNNPSEIRELIEKALELDPDYADAYALAGGYYLSTGSFAGNKEMQSAAKNSLPYLIRAIEIDPELSSAHFNLGTLYLWYNWDYIRAEEEYLKALKLEPNNPLYIGFYLEFLNKMNRPGEVIKLQKIPGAFYSDLAKTQLLMGNKAEAESMIQVYTDSLGRGGFPWIGECYLWMGEYELALNHLEIALNKDDQRMKSHRFQACLAISYHFTHREQQAQEILIKMRQASSISKAGSPDFWIGYIYSGIGELDSAFHYLEKAYHNRSTEMPWLKSDPIFNSLRNDPLYLDLYERTGHKAYDDYMAGRAALTKSE
jgi:tetratricopeptide (TPR) repeat protein